MPGTMSLKLSGLRLYSGVAEDCFFLDMTLHHKVISSASHVEGEYCLYFQESMLKEFFQDILPRDAGSNTSRTESSDTYFVVHRLPEKVYNNISLIWVIWCYLHISTLQCTWQGSEIQLWSFVACMPLFVLKSKGVAPITTGVRTFSKILGATGKVQARKLWQEARLVLSTHVVATAAWYPGSVHLCASVSQTLLKKKSQ